MTTKGGIERGGTSRSRENREELDEKREIGLFSREMRRVENTKIYTKCIFFSLSVLHVITIGIDSVHFFVVLFACLLYHSYFC